MPGMIQQYPALDNVSDFNSTAFRRLHLAPRRPNLAFQ